MLLSSYSFLWAGDCPQPRFTEKAPPDIYDMVNPLTSSIENILAGKALYEEKAKPMACKLCHGTKGDGRGGMSMGVHPQPRNFTCEKTINDVPDGQLFWIIRNGSPDTGMPAFEELEDGEIWQLIIYIRKLAQSEITEFQPGIFSKDIFGMR
jgi:mono/diheme cytochrome c family protein